MSDSRSMWAAALAVAVAGAIGLLERSLAIKPRQFAALANLGEDEENKQDEREP